MQSKQELRKFIKEIFKNTNLLDLKQKSEIISSKILNHHKVLNYQNIAIFIWISDEVETLDTITKLISMWKNIFLPKIINDDKMIFSQINSIDDLQTWKFGILEPKNNVDWANKIEIILVPWVAFTKDGKRLWRGKWYYDKFLSKHKNIYKIWVCYDFQIISDFQTDDWDEMMDEVIF